MAWTEPDRGLLKKLYPKSRNWSLKVDKMSDAQVTAILIKAKKDGKL